jgi:hypothetical protein
MVVRMSLVVVVLFSLHQERRRRKAELVVSNVVCHLRTSFFKLVVDDVNHLFVADHLCATFAVVEVVGDANHAHGADVVGGGGLYGASASHAAKHLDRGDGKSDCVHAVSVARVGRRGR